MRVLRNWLRSSLYLVNRTRCSYRTSRYAQYTDKPRWMKHHRYENKTCASRSSRSGSSSNSRYRRPFVADRHRQKPVAVREVLRRQILLFLLLRQRQHRNRRLPSIHAERVKSCWQATTKVTRMCWTNWRLTLWFLWSKTSPSGLTPFSVWQYSSYGTRALVMCHYKVSNWHLQFKNSASLTSPFYWTKCSREVFADQSHDSRITSCSVGLSRVQRNRRKTTVNWCYPVDS